MMSARMTNSWRMVAMAIVAVVAMAVLAVAAAPVTHALSNTAPDPSGADYGGSDPLFDLSNTPQNKTTSVNVPVYLPNKPTGNVSMSVTNFRYPWPSMGAAYNPKVSFQGGTCRSSATNFTIPKGSFTQDVATGYWLATATAKICSGTTVSDYTSVEFRLKVNVSGAYIGIGAGLMYSTISSHYYVNPTTNKTAYNYSIPFATPCNVSANTVKTIYLYDLDSGVMVGNAGLTVTVTVYDETAGSNVSFTPSGSKGNNGTYGIKMTFKPGHKYRLKVNRVHTNNTLMYKFPYDNISYKVGCAWSLLGINSQNRVQADGAGAYSSYGNYHEGSPRNVHVGDNVQFQHTVTNSGNMKTATFSRWRERKGWETIPAWAQQGGTYNSTLNAGASAHWPGAPTTYKIKASDVGLTMCERYSVKGQSSAKPSTTYNSVGSCVKVPYNFNLVPTLSGPSDSRAPGETIADVYPTVTNKLASYSTRTTESTKDVVWQLGRVDVPPTGSIPTGQASNSNTPQQQYGSSWVLKKSGKATFPTGATLLALLKNEKVALGTPVGTRICFTLSVSPYSPVPLAEQSTPHWRHAAPLCIQVNQRPTVQVIGNDLRVGSAFQGGTNLESGVTGKVMSDAASWSEYAILAPGSVAAFASQSGANGGSTSSQSAWSKLTFANTGVSGCASGYGCFAGASNMGYIPNVRSAVTSVKYNGAALNYDKGTASFNASTIPSIVPGANLSNFTKSASITTSGTITIDQDITYNTGTLGSGNAIPQLILIAKNINIKGNVKHIDAWLIATGTINTCNDVAQTALRSTNCSNQLTVNGAMMANQLLLNRTYYSDSKPADAAETLNLQGSSYVWASNVARQNGTWQTVYSTDLPPRY